MGKIFKKKLPSHKKPLLHKTVYQRDFLLRRHWFMWYWWLYSPAPGKGEVGECGKEEERRVPCDWTQPALAGHRGNDWEHQLRKCYVAKWKCSLHVYLPDLRQEREHKEPKHSIEQVDRRVKGWEPDKGQAFPYHGGTHSEEEQDTGEGNITSKESPWRPSGQ